MDLMIVTYLWMEKVKILHYLPNEGLPSANPEQLDSENWAGNQKKTQTMVHTTLVANKIYKL